MSFLYSSYIVLYAVFSTVLGRVIDKAFREDGTMKRELMYIAGIHFTCIGVFVFANTFVPKGAFAFNLDMLYAENLEAELEKSSKKGESPELLPTEADGKSSWMPIHIP